MCWCMLVRLYMWYIVYVCMYLCVLNCVYECMYLMVPACTLDCECVFDFEYLNVWFTVNERPWLYVCVIGRRALIVYECLSVYVIYCVCVCFPVWAYFECMYMCDSACMWVGFGVYVITSPSAWVGCGSRSILKQILTGFNSDFS